MTCDLENPYILIHEKKLSLIDKRDAESLYRILQNEVLPTWEEGNERWANMMRASIATSARFTGARMISDYRRFYDSFMDA